MDFAPTWDLFILVFFAIIVAYSFIVGREDTLKIIIATYISILATDSLGNMIDQVLVSKNPILNIFTAADQNSIIALKIIIFVFAIVLLTVRGSFFVEVTTDKSLLVNLTMTLTFGMLSAGLIVSTILVYMSGGAFVTDPTAAHAAGVDITGSSYLARTLTDNYNFWFAMPAIAFIATSLVGVESSSSNAGHGHEE